MSGTKIHDVAETTAVADRVLRDGTILRYQLSILQQPMRARACGMGAKCKQYLTVSVFLDQS